MSSPTSPMIEANRETDLIAALACFGQRDPDTERAVIAALRDTWEPGLTISRWTTIVAKRLGMRWDN